MLPVLLIIPLLCLSYLFPVTVAGPFTKSPNRYTIGGNNTESGLDIEVTPEQHTIVLLGQRRTIHIYCLSDVTAGICVKATLEGHPSHLSPVKVLEDEEVVYFTENSSDDGSVTRGAKAYASVDVLGLRPGRAKLKLELLHANFTQIGTLLDNYEIIVAEKLNLIHDGFVYILCSIQFLAMLMLGLRMRGAATKEVLIRPCGLITALLAQSVFVPLIYLGGSVLLSLDQHSTVALLLVGCCPPAVVGVMMAVVQQGHVELSIILLLLETLTAFGIMPGWLFTYGHFLGLAYAEVSFPYFHISAALGVVTLPTIIGIILRRCTPRVLTQLDKAIQPVSLLVVMVAVTIAIYNFMEKWALITWRLLLATSSVPLATFLIAITLCAVAKQKVPQLKAVAISTCLQNTLLATTIIQTSYPLESSSLMAVTIACVDMMSLGGLFLLYLLHIILWVLWPMYRMHHDNIGVSGVSKSFSERLVRNMLKAGEIRFCSRAANKKKQEETDGTPFCSNSGLVPNGNTPPQPKAHSSINTNLTSSVSNRLANLNMSFLGTLQPKDCSQKSSSDTADSEESDLSLHYFTRALPIPDPVHNNQSKISEANRDANSIKYDLMMKRDSSVQRQLCGTRGLHTKGKELMRRACLPLDADKELENLKELDRMTGYANCTGTTSNNREGWAICECAVDSDNTTNDVIETLAATSNVIETLKDTDDVIETLRDTNDVIGTLREIIDVTENLRDSDDVIQVPKTSEKPAVVTLERLEDDRADSEDDVNLNLDRQTEGQVQQDHKASRLGLGLVKVAGQVDDSGEYRCEKFQNNSEKDAAVWLEEKL